VTPIASSTVLSSSEDNVYWKDLRLDATYLYWLADRDDHTDIMRMPKAGGDAAIVVSIDETSFVDFTVDADGFIYIRTSDAVSRAPVKGGEPEELWHGDLGPVSANQTIISDAGHVYVYDFSALPATFPSSVYAISKDTKDAKTLGKLPDPQGLAQDDQFVYVAANGGSGLMVDGSESLDKYPDAALYRLPKAGGSAELVANVPYSLHGMQVTKSYIYGLLEERDELTGRSVVRVPLAGGQPERLGQLGCAWANELKISGDHLFYEDELGLVRTDLNGSDFASLDVGGSWYFEYAPAEIDVDGHNVFVLRPGIGAPSTLEQDVIQ
jgi:hypothetical protein